MKKTVLTLRLLYPIWMIAGMFSLIYVPAVTTVAGDAAATVRSLLTNETIFRLGIAGALLTQLIHLLAAVLLYKLFENTNKGIAKLIVIFSVVGISIAMASNLYMLASLDLIHQHVVNPLEVMNLLNLGNHGITIAAIFWGLWLFPTGYLAIKSKYFPKFIGYALYVGGIGYLLGSFAEIIAPTAIILTSIIEVLTLGEIVFIFWLVIRGVKSN